MREKRGKVNGEIKTPRRKWVLRRRDGNEDRGGGEGGTGKREKGKSPKCVISACVRKKRWFFAINAASSSSNPSSMRRRK